MSKFINDRATNLKQGGIRQFFDIASKYEKTINLGIGEPDSITSRPVIQSAFDAMLEGKTRYTSNAGDLSVRESVAKYMKSYGISYDPASEIILTCGGMGAISSSLLCIVSPGDEVLIQDPVWVNYISQVKFCGGIPVPVPTYERDAFSLKVDEIITRITPRTKVLILNSPCNPTGAIVSEDDMRQLVQIAQQHDLLVISDEVYCEMVYDGQKHLSIASFPGMKERTVVINSFSKTFAMTGWRLGFAAGPSEIISKMVLLQENMVACAPAPAQFAGKLALDTMCDVEQMRKKYQKRRDMVVGRINAISGISCLKPAGAFYIFINIKDLGITSSDFALGFLDQKHVVTVPGSAFGEHGEGYIRLSYANSDENLIEALNRMEQYVNGLSRKHL